MTTRYAAWAPQELIALIEDQSFERSEAEHAVLLRMAIDPEMEAMWNSLARHARRTKVRDPVTSFLGIVLVAGEFTEGSWFKKTTGERSKEVTRIHAAAIRLADLLETTDAPLNQDLLYFLTPQQKREMASYFLSSAIEFLGLLSGDSFAHPPKLPDALRQLASEALDSVSDRPRVGKPKAKHARRTYFIGLLVPDSPRPMGSRFTMPWRVLRKPISTIPQSISTQSKTRCVVQRRGVITTGDFRGARAAKNHR